MKRPSPPCRGQRRRGVALVSAMLVVMAAMAASLLMASMASTANTKAETARQRVRAQYLAEGALRIIEAQLREQYLGSGGQEAEAFLLETGSANLSGLFGETGTVQVDEHQVEYEVGAVGSSTEATGADGLIASVTVIEVEARADLPGAHARARSLLRMRLVPIYQFAVFYGLNMDLWPGEDMTITGRVHTNGDLHVGAYHTLRFDTNYVRCAGDLVQDRAWTNEEVQGTGQIQFRRWVDDPWNPAEPVEWVTLPRKSDLDGEGIPSTSGLDSRFSGHDANADGDYDDPGELAPFAVSIADVYSQPEFYTGGYGSTVLTGEHGVTPVVPPTVGVTSMYVAAPNGDYVWSATDGEYVATAPGTGTHQPGLYHDQAGLSIIVKDNGTWKAYQNGFDVSASLAGVVTISSIADVREGYDVDTATVDLVALEASGYFPANGLLYLGQYGGTPLSETKGFVLTNGSDLAGPLTTVTENALYVQGDFNTVDKKPAAVIADTVNLLSNSWDGTKVLSDGREVHDASTTTYDMAIVSGDLQPTWGSNSGGMNNLVRLHEDWSGHDLVLEGSLVSLWEPVYTDRPLSSSAYTVPDRLWTFDEDFLQLAGLPPFTPCYLELDRVATW